MGLRCALVALLALAAGCASYDGRGLVPGKASVAEVQALMGPPTLVREARDGGKLLWYSRLPFGRQSFAVRVDPAGTLVSIEQRLTQDQVAKLKPNVSTAEEVLDTLGPPYKVYPLPRQQREAWEYFIRTPAYEPYSVYVQLSPDRVVREVLQLYEGDDTSDR
jgi:hypothetical protein